MPHSVYRFVYGGRSVCFHMLPVVSPNVECRHLFPVVWVYAWEWDAGSHGGSVFNLLRNHQAMPSSWGWFVLVLVELFGWSPAPPGTR